MSEIRFFMPTSTFFSLVKPILEKEKISVIFRRYETCEFTAGWEVIHLDSEMADIYLYGGFREIYFSFGKTPKHNMDWAFTENASEQLLELTGGRMGKMILEEFVLRTFAKKSKANKLFNLIKRKIKSVSDCGKIVTLKGQQYPNIYYSSDSVGFKLYNDIYDKDISYQIIEKESELNN